jgi:HK97 family phage portal protein
LLNLTGALYDNGNAYVLALRNNRFEVAELHLMDARSSSPRIASTGEVFYALAGNPIVENSIPKELLAAVPARDVLHIRLDARNRYNPLLGEPPLTSALIDIAASNNMVQQALSYTANQARPSGVLMTEEDYNDDLFRAARARWDEVTKGAGAGGTPILTRGLKWQQTSTTSRDAQLAEMLQITDGRIASAYRVPLELLSLFGVQGNPQGSVENLMRFWIASGLGFCLNHIEEAWGRFFALDGWPDEYLEFDTAALERSNMKDRIEALARGVQGGIYSPNEARELEDLPAADDGDEPRVQQQVVPLSAWEKTPPVTPAPNAPPAAPPAGDGSGDAAAEQSAKALAAFRLANGRHLAA